VKTEEEDEGDVCGIDDDGSGDEPLWTPGTAPAAGMDDLFTGSGLVLPGVYESLTGRKNLFLVGWAECTRVRRRLEGGHLLCVRESACECV